MAENSNGYLPYLTFWSPNAFRLCCYDSDNYAYAKGWNGTMEYSTNTTTWSTWTGVDGAIISAQGSDGNYYLFVRGTGNNYVTGAESGYVWPTYNASASGFVSNLHIEGSIETLLDYQTVVNGGHPTMGDYAFRYMFYSNSGLVTAPDLPATTLSSYCYCCMFYTCSLTKAPALPAITLATRCYDNMFYGCTSLTAAPDLPATTLADYCYREMFQCCTSLTAVPALPATTLASNCYYNMFERCTSIKLSTTKDSTYRTPYKIPWINDGTTATNALTNMFSNTGGTFTGTPEINTTYYGDWDPDPILLTSNRTVDGVTKPYLVCSGTNILKQN